MHPLRKPVAWGLPNIACSVRGPITIVQLRECLYLKKQVDRVDAGGSCLLSVPTGLGVPVVPLTYATYVASRVPSERRPPMVDQIEFGYRATFYRSGGPFADRWQKLLIGLGRLGHKRRAQFDVHEPRVRVPWESRESRGADTHARGGHDPPWPRARHQLARADRWAGHPTQLVPGRSRAGGLANDCPPADSRRRTSSGGKKQ